LIDDDGNINYLKSWIRLFIKYDLPENIIKSLDFWKYVFDEGFDSTTSSIFKDFYKYHEHDKNDEDDEDDDSPTHYEDKELQKQLLLGRLRIPIELLADTQFLDMLFAKFSLQDIRTILY